MATTRPAAQSYIIKRPRLTKLLDESEARIILLCAPAGYGKTTLAREWVETRSEPVAWYRGGPETSDVAAVAAGVAEALATEEGPERAPRDLTERVRRLAAQGLGPAVLARAVLASLDAATSVALVIDDYQDAISTEAESFFAALGASASLRLVIASRTRPEWVTARMEIYGEALVIDTEELAFSEAEGRVVLKGASVTDMARILLQARGWPALIGLAAARGRLTNSEGDLLPRDLYAFFAEDIFLSTDRKMQDVLYWIALSGDKHLDIVQELVTTGCDLLLSGAIVRGLLGRTPDGIQLHPLLRTFVLAKLQELPAKEIEARVEAVVSRLSDRHAWDETLAVLEAFPQQEQICSALRSALEDLLASGRVATVNRWAKLARDCGGTDPVLLIAEAEVAMRQRDEIRAQSLAMRAAGLLGRGDAAARAHLTAARAAHLNGDSEAARRLSREGATLAESEAVKCESLWLAYVTAFEAGTPETFERLRELEQLGDEGIGDPVRLGAAQAIVALEWERQPRVAIRICESTEALLGPMTDPLTHTNFLNVFSCSALLLAEYEHALTLAAKEAHVAWKNGLEFVIDHSLITQARALIGLRRLNAAHRAVRELDRRSDSSSEFVEVGRVLNEVKLRIALGDLERASILLRIEPPSWPLSIRAEMLGHRALVFAARGELDAARESMAQAQAASQFIESVAFTGLSRAVLALREGNQNDAAVFYLADVLEAGNLDAVVTACRAFPPLAEAGAKHERTAQPLTDLFARSNDIDLGRQAGLEMPRELRRNDGLSPRELDVYELLVQGRTNKEIAKALFIGESTTKVHVRHIFEKLGVHSRAEAASLAVADRLNVGR